MNTIIKRAGKQKPAQYTAKKEECQMDTRRCQIWVKKRVHALLLADSAARGECLYQTAGRIIEEYFRNPKTKEGALAALQNRFDRHEKTK